MHKQSHIHTQTIINQLKVKWLSQIKDCKGMKGMREWVREGWVRGFGVGGGRGGRRKGVREGGREVTVIMLLNGGHIQILG